MISLFVFRRYIMSTLVLAHSGTKGMHWYQRRYQNYDGSLTAEGRIHYGVGASRGSKASSYGSGKVVKKKKETYGQYKKRKIAEKQSELQKQSEKLFNDSEYTKAFNAWKKQHPNSDEDDFDDYISDKLQRRLDKDSKWDQGAKIGRQAASLKPGFVKEETKNNALLGTVLGATVGAPVAAVVSPKGQKLRNALATTAIIGTASAMDANKKARIEKRKTLKEYGLDNKTLRNEYKVKKTNYGSSSILDKANRNDLQNTRQDADRFIEGSNRLRQVGRKKTDLSQYSDAELQKIVNRQQLEQRYNQLNPDKIDKGSAIMRESLQTAGAAAGLYLTYKTLKKM